MSASLLVNPHSSMASYRRVELDRMSPCREATGCARRVAAATQKWRWTGADGAKMLLQG